MSKKTSYEELKSKVAKLEQKIIKYKQTEKVLEDAKQEYRILLDESADPIFSFSQEGKYHYVNQAFARGVGKVPDQIIGNTLWDVFSKEEADKRFAALSQVFQTGIEKVCYL